VLALILAACGGGVTPTAAPAQPTREPVAQPTEPPAAPPTEIPAAQPTEPPAKAEPAVLRFGWKGQPDTLNPAYAFLTESFAIFDLIYNTLVKEDQNGEYVGDLATEWKVSDDGLTWTFTIHDNVKFHDGTPVTAEDIAWSINAVMQDPDGWIAVSDYTSGFKEVTAPDAQTVQIVTEYPIGNMPYRVTWLYTLPRKDFEGFKTAKELQDFLNENAIGTGAFKLTTFDKDKGIVILDANPDYFLGRPKVDQVIFQQYDNADAMVQALKVGEVDALFEVPSTAVEPLQSSEGVKVVQQPSRSFDELIINSTPDTNNPAPTNNPALNDPQVRLAIAHAINKQDLVDIVLLGLGKPGDTIIAPAMGAGFWHSPNIQEVPFSLEQANQILEDAGYVKGSDGVRAKGDTRLEFRLQYPSDSITYPRVAELLAGWLKEVGIEATPEAVDPDTLIAATTGVGDYDLVVWGWGGADADPNFMLSTMTSDQFVSGGWSDSGYSNPKYDELYEKQQQTTDPAERQKIIWEMQEMVFNDRPYIVFWYPDTLQAFRSDRFKGFIESSTVEIQDSDSLRQVEPVP
jgi:peptide/nickel transport system substrate-binding protein